MTGDGAVSGPAPAEAALGQATPNAQYLGRRLMYDQEPEASFDPLDNTRLLRQFLLRAVLFYALYFIGGIISAVAFLILGLIGLGLAAEYLWFIASIIFSLLFLGLVLFVPVPVQISEWKFFVDGKASVATVAFDHIAWVLQQRQTPLEQVQVRRLNLAAGESRDYLEIRRGLFSGLISCFAYGNDLYLGWTFWLRISLARCLLMFVVRVWQTVTHQVNDMYVKLRYDYARAMREAMHSAAREGLDVATGQTRPQGKGAGSSYTVAVVDVGA